MYVKRFPKFDKEEFQQEMLLDFGMVFSLTKSTKKVRYECFATVMFGLHGKPAV